MTTLDDMRVEALRQASVDEGAHAPFAPNTDAVVKRAERYFEFLSGHSKPPSITPITSVVCGQRGDGSATYYWTDVASSISPQPK